AAADQPGTRHAEPAVKAALELPRGERAQKKNDAADAEQQADSPTGRSVVMLDHAVMDGGGVVNMFDRAFHNRALNSLVLNNRRFVGHIFPQCLPVPGRLTGLCNGSV